MYFQKIGSNCVGDFYASNINEVFNIFCLPEHLSIKKEKGTKILQISLKEKQYNWEIKLAKNVLKRTELALKNSYVEKLSYFYKTNSQLLILAFDSCIGRSPELNRNRFKQLFVEEIIYVIQIQVNHAINPFDISQWRLKPF